ncbi:GCN5-like N-acetyltransferase [Halteromyces radiatus]|uniref:GCN5-like N-acetyltransferase n=1 Tax=Halteromyces radiatus TaxID=101107 RepID=UPI00221F05D2|nr:GCN5-like N-acetyltransferase [Halteromyces radiatus]KAI8100123.1 GCN5-like N-acetyltransferase [Halteromyces radiatus]
MIETTLRPATELDADLLARIHTLSWQTAYRGILPTKYLDHDILRERQLYWQQAMTKAPSDERLVLIAEDKHGEAIGFVSGEWDRDCGYGALLDHFHVLPEHQGKGGGWQLMEAFMAWARQLGVSRLYLYVLDQNENAIRFYERRGWRFADHHVGHLGGVDLASRRYEYIF